MKKFCTKISTQQWRVAVPGVNATIFRKSAAATGEAVDEQRRTSSGSYDLPGAQREFELRGAMAHGEVAESMNTGTSSTGTYEDASQGDLYDSVHLPAVVESTSLTAANARFEYDVPQIHFSFETGDRRTSDGLPERAPVLHKSQLQIVVTNVLDVRSSEMKFGSDPNVNRDEEDEEDGEFYKVPRRIRAQSHRLSKSLHDFNGTDELSLPQLATMEDESIEHVSCSQVLPALSEDTPATGAPRPARPGGVRTRRRWDAFKSRLQRVVAEHAAQQRVGAFSDRDRIAVNIEEMYKHSKDRCKRIIKRTGRMFKRSQENVDPNRSATDTSSQIIKNDAFFAKIKATDIEYILPYHVEKRLAANGGPADLNADVVEEDDEKASSDNGEQSGGKPVGLGYADGNSVRKRKRIANAIADEVVQMKNGFRKSRLQIEGQNGFDDLRRYVKQGGDFCKELATILQERSDAELQYSKSLSKLSTKLSRACREGVGGLNEAWKAVANELESRATAHRHMAHILSEETAKTLKSLSENHNRQRKHAEILVDKAAKVLSEWRSNEAKSKKHSHSCARDNEKLQDAMLDNRISRSTSLIQLANMHKQNSDKETVKLEGKKRKAEDAVKKADIEYYSYCVQSERARLEWESAVLKGVTSFQSLEEERLSNLKTALLCYLEHNADLSPKLTTATETMRMPIENADPQKDLTAFTSLRERSQHTSEQLLPDFYCEHITLAMNRERRKQALVKLMQLIKLDIAREKKSKDGLETLSKAIKYTPSFGTDDNQQTVTEKLYHMRSMLTYLEGAKYKVQSALAELDCRPRTGHPLASHITVTRDKAGLQQSILKTPIWLKDQWTDDEVKTIKIDNDDEALNNWTDRGMADGNSNQHDSDFDGFSSQGSSVYEGNGANPDNSMPPIAEVKALYPYTPNLPDELLIRPGDKVLVYRQQEDGWWYGECNGSIGIFPCTYVETVKS